MKRLSVVAAVVLMLMMAVPRGGSALEVPVSPLVSCEPDCTGTATLDKVPDPLNCTNYYYCFSGVPASHPNSCGVGSHFDPETLECGAGEECEALCGGGSGCAITCNSTTTVVANPFNCSTYYFCTPGGPELAECNTDFPYFDGTACTHDDSVCCPPLCNAYCDGSGFALVPDPEDCAGFYVCQEGVTGEPDEEFHYECGDGQYFNIALGDCESGDPAACTTLCDAAGKTTTTTTSTSTTSSGGGVSSSGGSTSGGGGSTSGGGDTSTSTTSTTSTTTTTGDCVGSLTCTAQGFFPACHSCQPQYFNCAGPGVAGVMGTCSDGTVFNPTPGYAYCVLPSNCPYP